MPDFVRVKVGETTEYLDRRENGNWSKQIRAPTMPGQYKMKLEVGNPDGSILFYEPDQNIIVMSKCFDMGQHGKLNEILIKRIVLAIAGCASHVLVKNSSIIVLVKIDNYDMSVMRNIEKVLRRKIPAHFYLFVKKYYATCNDILNDFFSCGNILDCFDSCQAVLDYIPKHFGTCLELMRNFVTCDELLSYPNCQAVTNHNARDFAICNEITTGFRTCKDVMDNYETCDEVQIYKPVEPLKEGFLICP